MIWDMVRLVNFINTRYMAFGVCEYLCRLSDAVGWASKGLGVWIVAFGRQCNPRIWENSMSSEDF
jgi:hypothetical protein